MTYRNPSRPRVGNSLGWKYRISICASTVFEAIGMDEMTQGDDVRNRKASTESQSGDKIISQVLYLRKHRRIAIKSMMA